MQNKKFKRSKALIKKIQLQDTLWTSVFLVMNQIFCTWLKILSQFGHNVWKYRLMNYVTESFNTTMEQMTEMFQQNKTSCELLAQCDKFVKQ